jgi:hypothetical protein
MEVRGPLKEPMTDEKSLLASISVSLKKVAEATECSSLTTKDKVIIGTLVMSIMGFIVTTFRQLHYKRIDTMLEFQKRFQELFESRLVNQKQREWLYWSLQQQQFMTWRRGLLPHTTYHFWMSRRVLEHSTGSTSNLTSWESHKEYFAETHYFDFMTELLTNGPKAPNVVIARAHAQKVLWEHSYLVTRLRFGFMRCYPEGPILYLCEPHRLVISLALLCFALLVLYFVVPIVRGVSP